MNMSEPSTWCCGSPSQAAPSSAASGSKRSRRAVSTSSAVSFVRVQHHKTGAVVSLPLQGRDGPLFPELAAYLDTLERLGVPVVLMRSKLGRPAKPFLQRTVRNRVRAAARVAKLAEDLTLAACRHGGLTELGDAELTEQGVMALSGHETPEASRLYVKRTETQRTAAARKRRAWVDLQSEQDMDASRNRPPARESEDAAK